MKKIIYLAAGVGIIASGGAYYWRFGSQEKAQRTAKNRPEPYVNPFIGFSISKKVYPVIYTLDQSRDSQIVINKKHALPAEYTPELVQDSGVALVPEAMEAYKSLIREAGRVGVTLNPISSYRSYSDQQKIFNEYVSRDGQSKAETYSARPGHSEHQSGLAIDIGLPSGSCSLMICMASTPEGKWLAENSHKYGFIIRYPEGKEAETGYQYEPWHIRYVGIDTATAIYESGYTLDAYFGITAGEYMPQATTN